MLHHTKKFMLALKKVQVVKNTPCQIPTTQQKIILAKFFIAPTGEKALAFNAISESMNFPFAKKEDFLEKLTNITITIVYLLFFSMLTWFIKDP